MILKPHRGLAIAGFLAQQGWDHAVPTPLAADFSSRRYARLVKEDQQSAILMDADEDQKTVSFVHIAKVLEALDISAPRIFAADPIQGLVLMEDFGNHNMGQFIDAGADATGLLKRAVDVLVHLHRTFTPDLLQDVDVPLFNQELFLLQVSLFLDSYVPFYQLHDVTAEVRQAFLAAWQQALVAVEPMPKSLLLRDYMADNLMDLAERPAWRSVGVLDFQDAGIGPVAYDLASLAEKVRRDDTDGRLDELVSYYYAHMNPSYALDDLRAACYVLSALRHTRILGLLMHMTHRGRPEKQAFIPRVRGALAAQLRHDVLKPVAAWFKEYSPLDE